MLPSNALICSHIHSEIDISCRYVARSCDTRQARCKQVLENRRLHTAGHDYEEATRAAWAAYPAQQGEARALGAGSWVRSTWALAGTVLVIAVH